MELQTSAVQSFRNSYARTKAISKDLKAIMKKQVDNIISIESIMSNYTYSPKKNLSISQKNINSDDFKNVEKLFEFDSNSD